MEILILDGHPLLPSAAIIRMSELSPNYTETTQSALKAVSKKVILTNGLIQYASACSLLNSPALPLLSEERSANFPLSKRHDQV